MRSTWLSDNASRKTSSTTRTKAVSVRRLHMAAVVGKQASAPRWAPSGMLTTTPWRRASFRHWSVNCWAGVPSLRRPRREWPASLTSKPSTIRHACTKASAIALPSTTKGATTMAKLPLPHLPKFADRPRIGVIPVLHTCAEHRVSFDPLRKPVLTRVQSPEPEAGQRLANGCDGDRQIVAKHCRVLLAGRPGSEGCLSIVDRSVAS